MKGALALLGGKPVISKKFPAYNTIDDNEKKEVMEVLNSGVLSAYLGAANDGFLGGAKVKKLERAWEDYFGVKFAVSMNSATCALMAAVSACGAGPGDEVILPPLTMCATGTAILFNNAIPIFADIDPQTMNIDPVSVEQHITSRTKAIFVVHLAGHPADMDPIMEIARKHKLFVLGDNAQSPGALYKGRFAGCIEDIGVFSLNCHKTIQTGEGGIAVTNDEELAFRLRLVRNHGENCTAGFHRPELDILGLNLRMTEMEAAVGYHQLNKLKMLNEWRQRLAQYLSKRIRATFDFIEPPFVADDCTHVYYLYHMSYDAVKAGIPLDLFAKAIRAEGIPVFSRWGSPLYYLPIYQHMSEYAGKSGECKPPYYGKTKYSRGICPKAEASEETSFFIETLVRWPNTESDMDLVIDAIQKVIDHRDELMSLRNEI
ncbi:MAG: DegT/DnrJ/EryC1/StrS family aminotransferase [Candidatus Omnitrophica bacterium]|nr:DegT/DnrJ/EryC1/StrS family aminotransferase [Candidatus Omnitrophota bacterium]